jgi:membrane protease YdiL (CAAX protease family)
MMTSIAHKQRSLAGLRDPAPSLADYLESAARGETNWWRYAASVVLALFLAVACPALVVLALMLLHLWPADLLATAQDPAHPVAFFLFNGVLFLAVLAGFVVAVRLLHRKRFGDLIGAWRWRDFGAGFSIWAVVLVAGTLIDVAVAPHGFRFAATRETPGLVLAAALGLAVQTFTEEFVFRGYATQGLLLATRRVAPTAVLSGLLFGAVHIPNGAPQAVSATIFGVVLAVIAMRTGSLAFTFGLHLVNNLFGAVVVASSGDAFRGAPALFSQSTPQLMWWDTAVGAVGLLAVAWLMLRRRPLDQSRTPSADTSPSGVDSP